MINTKRFTGLIAAGLFGFIMLPTQAEENGVDHGDKPTLPESITSLINQGLKFHGAFDVPGDIQGYALSYNSEPVAAYVPFTEDYAIVGKLIDPLGNDAMESKVQSIVLGPILEAAWSKFEDTRFVAEGNDNASHIVYTITDPNCPYCNALWKSSRPLIEQGELQLRHILVGVLSKDSIRKAAAILESDNPAQALEAHELNFRGGGIEPVEPSKASWELLAHHARIMREAGVTGTPTSYYRDEKGMVQRIGGAVSTSQLRKILGIE